MFRLNPKIALRNLWKNKGYTFINIAGLSIGMASCILIFIFIRYQLSFDQQFVNKDRIYRVVSSWKYIDKEEFQSGVPRPLAAAMRNDFGMLEEVAALQGGGGIIKIKDQSGNLRLKTAEDVFYIEPGFFKIFNYQWLEGNPQQALVQPNTVALSQKMASRFFGDWHKAVGQTFQYRDRLLKVTGVFADTPENSSNPINIAIAYAGYEDKNMKNWYAVLFGLISFVATQRTKEMAIRKVLGASTFELISMLNFSFITLVLLANLIAGPIAYLLIDKWLSGYTYRIELNIWPFLIVTSISMVATLLTVSFRSFSAARTNPVDALKEE